MPDLKATGKDVHLSIDGRKVPFSSIDQSPSERDVRDADQWTVRFDGDHLDVLSSLDCTDVAIETPTARLVPNVSNSRLYITTDSGHLIAGTERMQTVLHLTVNRVDVETGPSANTDPQPSESSAD